MSVTSKKKLLNRLRNKEFRDAYGAEHVKTSVPLQIRTLRDSREWTQARLAQEAGTTQTVISRLEDPNYGNLSINSLLKLASAFDVALLVKFVPFSRLLREFRDVSPESVAAASFENDTNVLEEWGTAESIEPLVSRGTAANVLLHLVDTPPTATVAATSFQPALPVRNLRLVVDNEIDATPNTTTASMAAIQPLASVVEYTALGR